MSKSEKCLGCVFGSDRLLVKFLGGILLCGSTLYGSPVSVVPSVGFVGSYFPENGYVTDSKVVPYAASYYNSTIVNGYTETLSETGKATFTTIGLSVNDSFVEDTVPEVFSMPAVSVAAPVYLSESVTFSYGFLRSTPDPNSGYTGLITAKTGFFDSLGNQVGTGCSVQGQEDAYPLADSGTLTCSTGLVLVNESATISVENDLQSFLLNGSYGEDVILNATSTIGPLQVYDRNQNLIETLDLNDLVPTPEPAGFMLMMTGLVGFGWRFIARRR